LVETSHEIRVNQQVKTDNHPSQ